MAPRYTFTVVGDQHDRDSSRVDRSPARHARSPTSPTRARRWRRRRPPHPDPWVGGEIVELTNSSGTSHDSAATDSGTRSRRNYVNGGIEDRAAYLFPMDQTLAAGQKLRVRFGAAPAQLPAAPGEHALPVDTASHVHRADGRLRRAGQPEPGAGRLRGHARRDLPARPAAVASPSSPVGVTARTTPSSVTVNWGAPISRGGTPITRYTATAYNAPIGGSADRLVHRRGRLSGHAPSQVASAPSTTSRSWRTTPRASLARRGASSPLRGPCPAHLGPWPSPGRPVGST